MNAVAWDTGHGWTRWHLTTGTGRTLCGKDLGRRFSTVLVENLSLTDGTCEECVRALEANLRAVV